MMDQYAGDLFQDIERHMDKYVNELCEFLRIPSISASTEHVDDMVRAAEWILDKLKALGFSGELRYVEGPPIVMARYDCKKEAPTLLIYGHYDVQPESPIEEWKSSPFEPVIRDGAIFARGVNDDKGQLYTYIKAIETCKRVYGDLPLNIIFIVEGEEEVGSGSLLSFIEDNRDELCCDVFFVSDSSMFSKDIPAITCGFRGIAYFELSIQTMTKDLHSGLFGGIALNAIEVLTRILAEMKDTDGHILIPDFYDGIMPINECERQQLGQIEYDEVEIAKGLGMAKLYGECEYSALERKSLRPTLDINGICGGYIGEGTKTVIPSKASAKISARLVPGQTPEKVFEDLKKFIQERIPRGVEADIRYMFGSMPVSVDILSPNVKLASQAIKKGFGRAPVFIRSGGTIHVIGHIQNMLHIPSVLILGWGRPENGSHSPNECFHIVDFKHATRSLALLLTAFANKERV